MQAVYDLSKYPCNFNFFEFLVASTTAGCNHVVFDDSKGYKSKFPKAETIRRVESILMPACELAGVTHEFGYGTGYDPGYHISVVLEAYKKNGRIEKLKSPLPPKDVRYTVTLRNSKRYKERNSDRDSWLRFALEIGAVVIEDHDDEPIDLLERMSLYCGAEMNYMVANGPVMLCFLSEAPVTAFMKNVNEAYHREHKFPVGSQLPWFNERQKAVWSGDSYEELIGHRRLVVSDCGS